MSTRVDYYDAQYGNFASEVFVDVRREVFGEDIGQNGWITADEQDLFIDWLALEGSSRLIDVACGSGGPAMRIAERTGCEVDGVDIHEDGVAAGQGEAARRGMAGRVRFQRADASEPLPFPDDHFDALICIDALNHLEDRKRIFGEWRRVLRPGGRAVFTDPIVVTGMLTNQEIATRSSIGYFIFTPPGVNAALLEATGFEVRTELDRTENMAGMAGRWRDARASREAAIRGIEGDAAYHGQQEFFRVASLLAAERRLSRFAYLAVKL